MSTHTSRQTHKHRQRELREVERDREMKIFFRFLFLALPPPPPRQAFSCYLTCLRVLNVEEVVIEEIVAIEGRSKFLDVPLERHAAELFVS